MVDDCFVVERLPKGTAKTVKERLQENPPKEMSLPEKEILCVMLKESDLLPLETRPLKMRYGKPETEYVIPDDKRKEILKQVCPFNIVPALEDEMYDIHEDKFFTVRDYRVIRCRNRNMLVSPYYPISGGMIVDWVPKEQAAETMVVTKARKA